MQQLLEKRRRLEDEVEAQLGVLREAGVPFRSQNGQSDLVDSEGFPRSDIDVYAVRMARNRLYQLKTDLDDVAKTLEKTVITSYQSRSDDALASRPAAHTSERRKAIARINSVAAGSPSAAANLRQNDLVILFAHVDANSVRPLEQLGPIVASNVDKKIDVIVERDGRLVKLQLTPATWSGRGLLGCHLLPV